ncbi:MAG TPA: polysaccharide deacetylase family protein [Candidatus Dormibacteraeota bacterium]|nr:polysaccharide deacetylase family protein [Candidatus Dormibacteraeota bacterium]
MGKWTNRAGRGGILVLLLLIAGTLPGAGFLRAIPLAVPSIVPGTAFDDLDEPNGLIVARASRPAATPTAAAQQLILAELQPKRAPVPLGPVTYVPILYYHYIRINPNPRDRVGFSLSTTPAMFRMQMQYLADHGFHVISLHQAVVAIKNHSGLPSRPVVLTFDDGYADFYTTAIPVLQSHGFTATSFVISGRMGWRGFMTPSQVVAADGMGFTIGAHTVDHVALAAQPPARATWEMKQSKLMLEDLLGHPVLDFAYPYGSFNGYDMAQARSLGFETAASTMSGSMHSAGQLFELSRLRIGGGLPLSAFARVVGGAPPTSAELSGSGGSPAPSPSAAPAATPSSAPSPTPGPSPSASPTP